VQTNEDDPLTGGHNTQVRREANSVSIPTTTTTTTKETLLSALSILFFVMLGLVVIVATVKSHADYSREHGGEGFTSKPPTLSSSRSNNTNLHFPPSGR
jgi:hypothetical protein